MQCPFQYWKLSQKNFVNVMELPDFLPPIMHRRYTYNNMEKIESSIIKYIIWTLLPISFFVVFWWSLAALDIYNLVSVQDKYIALFALAGLGFGLVITNYMKTYLYKNFYNIQYKYLAFFSSYQVHLLLSSR